MDGTRKVIVGVATYNNEEEIDNTLQLLLNQTRPPDKLVFCDKSDDGTRDRIRSHTDTGQTKIEIIDQSGDGVADAYNEILDHISGEYDIFATIQTEITVAETWLEDHIVLHENHPEIEMVMGDNKENDPTDREVQPDERPYYVGRNFSAKSGVLERIDGWDPNFLRGEDWDMRIRLAGAETRVYAKTDLGYWKDWSDPYVSLSKAKRKPTSVTFLKKYGRWYLGFHPSHVLADTLSLTAILSAACTIGFLPLIPRVAMGSTILFIFSVFLYLVGHIIFRGAVDKEILIGPVRKQMLNGIAVLYALNRIVLNNVEWNMSGFNPENIPRYKF